MKLHVHFSQRFQRMLHGFRACESGLCSKPGIQIRFCAINGQRIIFLCQLAQKKEREQPAADNGYILFLLHAKSTARLCRRAISRERPFQMSNSNALAHFTQLAGFFAWRLTAFRQKMRKRRIFFVERVRLVKIAFRKGSQNGFHIDL